MSAAAQVARGGGGGGDGQPLYTLVRAPRRGRRQGGYGITTSGQLREEFVRGTFPVKYRWVRHADTAACGVTAGGRSKGQSRAREHAVWWNENALSVICAFLPARALSRLSRVNRCARPLTRCEDLWRRLCRLEFGVVPESLEPPPGTSQALYQHLHARRRDLLRRSMRARTLSASDLRIPSL